MMNNLVKILPFILLIIILIPESKYSQNNQPQSASFKLDYSLFMSSSMKAENNNYNLVGLLGDAFVKGGSSQNFRFNGDVYFANYLITDMNENIDLGIPKQFELLQNYPNPFNPSTTIKFSLPEEGFVNLTVYNMLGQNVSELVSEYKKAGYHEVKFNAGSLSSGFYIYRITSAKFNSTKKMLLIK